MSTTLGLLLDQEGVHRRYWRTRVVVEYLSEVEELNRVNSILMNRCMCYYRPIVMIRLKEGLI